jgi:hypothetical protein
MTANNSLLSQSLDSLLMAKDRTGLNLPLKQVCDTCQRDLDNTHYSLKKRNQHMTHLPDELETTCKDCKKSGKKIGKGLYLKAVRSGDLMLSDAAIKALRDNNGQRQKELIDALIGMAISRDIDAMKILVSLVQGRPSVVRAELPVQSDTISPDEETSSEDLLKKLETHNE